MGRASMGRNSLGRKIKNTPLIKKIDLSSAQGVSARRRSPPIGGERLRGDFPRAEIPVPHFYNIHTYIGGKLIFLKIKVEKQAFR